MKNIDKSVKFSKELDKLNDLGENIVSVKPCFQALF